jgi:transcriptional regulator with PAS, ATPase and Fis domain
MPTSAIGRWPLAAKVASGFAVALAILIVVGAVSYRTTTRFLDELQWQVHSHRVLDELDALHISLHQAETGQRGFVLTGEEPYLEPYHAALVNIGRELADLKRLTAEHPGQRERIAALEPLVDAKLSELHDTIALRRQGGRRAALDIVREGHGREVMDRISAHLAAIGEAEHDRLVTLEQEAEAGGHRTIWVIVVGCMVAFALVAIATLLITHDIRERNRAEEALQAAHGALDQRVQERTGELARTTEELHREVVERREAQERLAVALHDMERSHDDMLSVLDQLRIGTALVDEHSHVVFVSHHGCFLFDQPRETILGRPWHEVLPLSDADCQALLATVAEPPERRRRVAAHIESRSGRHYWTEVEVRDDPRAPERRMFFFYDVSEVHDLRNLLDQRARFHGFVGKSPVMAQLYEQVASVAAVDSTVLIEGETGTGKELVARTIHDSSHRRDGPFVAVNCAALIESLVESQLFGHRRGAFTGAVADQQGIFESAHGGTLFLDEIGDIPKGLQTSLLRVLEAREIVRLGETRSRKVDVRVIAATHHDLAHDVERGDFRADLLYRIRVARIRVPPLRERREDIPLLVAWFLGQHRAASGALVDEVDRDAMRSLLEYPWPGNVRELRSAVEFGVVGCAGRVLRACDLPPEIRRVDTDGVHHGHAAEIVDQRTALMDALGRAGGNRTVAARLLGMSRATFYRRLDALGMTPARTPEGDGAPPREPEPWIGAPSSRVTRS